MRVKFADLTEVCVRKVLILIAICLLPHNSFALTWGELNAEITASEAGEEVRQEIVLRLMDIVQMTVVFRQSLAAAEADVLLFCPGPGQGMSLDEVTSMVRAQARREQACDEVLVQNLVLDAFRDAPPCS